MLKQDYQAWMDQVEPGRDFQARLTEAIAAQPVRRPRRIWRTVLAAAAVCGVLMVSAFALSPTLRQMLESALGGYTGYAQAVEGTAVANRVEIRVVSALDDGSMVKVYAEAKDLEGERLSGPLDVMGVIRPLEEMKSVSTFGGKWLGYDEESGAALLEFTTWGLPSRNKDQMELVVTILRPEDQSVGDDSWYIDFHVEKLPVRSFPLTGVVDGTPLCQVDLSVLGVSIRSSGSGTIYSYPMTVFCADGRRLQLTWGGGGSVGDTRLTCWEYDEPVEPEEVTGLALGQWYIPLEGENAGQGHWLEEQP